MASDMADPSSLPYSANSCLPHLPPREASVALSLFYTVLLVFSALGNILALCLACQKDKKINSTGVYLVHLAVSDLLFSLALPGKITYYVLDFSWPFGDGLCRLTAFIMYLNTYGGVYLMTCVSVDRYLAVVCTHQSQRLRSTGRAKLICVAVWVLALLQNVPLLLTPMAKPMAGKLTCMEYVSVEPILGLPVMVLAACAISFCMPVVIILFCYVKIALKLCSTARENPVASGKGHPRRACLLTLVVLVAVVLCFSPYHLNVMQFMVREMLGPPSCAEQRAFTLALQVTVSFMNVNCGIDPIIYFFASTRYRKWLLGILKLGASSSSSFSSSSPGRASSETQTGGSVTILENQV
ncbi:G-protein coupled receptor 183-like [Marmota marmota marmota]|uniref:G-protein coupled receptor 183-like n=1 Tax=Marmota marmota marmota TaxID=9994 RepID=UPI000FFFB840|nr:G-protein coupled receptor 183-like isoform X1 [Marmota flaviventris]XP_027794668.1 G-protein coupled receptor 183-like isoform X1 [Marmota flaviventris]XP_048656497.1 G-protein coupled receptor 183-like [Marmota marmota marmota]